MHLCVVLGGEQLSPRNTTTPELAQKALASAVKEPKLLPREAGIPEGGLSLDHVVLTAHDLVEDGMGETPPRNKRPRVQ